MQIPLPPFCFHVIPTYMYGVLLCSIIIYSSCHIALVMLFFIIVNHSIKTYGVGLDMASSHNIQCDHGPMVRCIHLERIV